MIHYLKLFFSNDYWSRALHRIVFNRPMPLFCLIVLLSAGTNVFAKGTLSPNWRFDSQVLGYPLQYRVYLPEKANEETEWPTIYITDGQWYLSQGQIIDVLDREIAEGNIEPVVAVFVDSRNPDDLSENRRTEEFICNPKYVSFYLNELVPTITANFPVSNVRENRVIAGLSFGGLNAACFGLMASNMFGGIGMQSPANAYYLPVIIKQYKESQPEHLKVFLSVGKKKDNELDVRILRRTLKKKGLDVTYIEVPFGHEWANWRPLMDDMLETFFACESARQSQK